MAASSLLTAPTSTWAVLVGALAVAVPSIAALWHQAYRHKRTGPKEEDELVARAAREAVEAMNQVLTAAREERTSLLERMRKLESRVRELTRENAELKAAVGRLRPSAET